MAVSFGPSGAAYVSAITVSIQAQRFCVRCTNLLHPTQNSIAQVAGEYCVPGYDRFAQLLDEYLRDQDRNAAWLAKRLGVHPATVGRWLQGETRPDAPETVIRIADCLGVGNGAPRAALLEAAGYAAAVTPVGHRHRPLVRFAGRAAARLPDWLAAPLLAQPAIYAAQPWSAPSTLTPPGCGDAGLDLGRQRLALSSAFGPYFAGLLERPQIYVELAGQVEAPAPEELAQLSPLERMAWALNNPRGPRSLVVAAEAGMGKSTLAAHLVRCLLQQGDFDLLLGDSAKQSHVDLASSAVEPLSAGFWNVDSCFDRLRSQLGLPANTSRETGDLADRLAGRRTLIVIDNLETVRGRDELLRRLGRLLGRDVRALLTTRQVDALPAFAQTHMLVQLQPLANPPSLTAFLRWYVQQYAAEQPLLAQTEMQELSSAHQTQLIAATGGIPLLVQLVYSSVARFSWAYLDHLPHLYGDDLLAFLYAERRQELAAAGPAGRCAQELLVYVAAAQVKGERVDFVALHRWAERSEAALLPAALALLHERFLLLNSDRSAGNFSLFPSLVEYVQRWR